MKQRNPTKYVATGGIAAVSAVLLIAVAAFLSTWLWPSAPALVSAEVLSEAPIHIGTPVHCRARVEAPWHRWPLEASIANLPDGLNLLSAGSPRLASVGWGIWRWEVDIFVQPYDLDLDGILSLEIDFVDSRRGPDARIAVVFPGVEVSPRRFADPRLPLASAPPIEPTPGSEQTTHYWIALAVLCAVILLISLSVLARRPPDGELDMPGCDQIALGELQRLEQALPMPAERFFNRVTDLLKWYLEQRFGLRAAEMTTPEFAALQHTRRQFAEPQWRLITQFMASADVVRFARGHATDRQMIEAITKARELIHNTAEGRDSDAVARTVPRRTERTVAGGGS